MGTLLTDGLIDITSSHKPHTLLVTHLASKVQNIYLYSIHNFSLSKIASWHGKYLGLNTLGHFA